MASSSSKSITEQLADLSNPSPLIESDDEFGGDTRAKLLSRSGQDDGDVEPGSLESGRIRRQAAGNLQETDGRYEGRKTSRRNIQDDSGDESSAESGDDAADEVDLSSFKKLVMKQPDPDNTANVDDGDEDSKDGGMEQGDDLSSDNDDKDVYSGKIWQQIKKTDIDEGDEDKVSASDDEDDDLDDEIEDDENDVQDDEDVDDDDDEVDDEDDDASGSDDIEVVTKVNLSEEIEKGLAAKNQQGLWDNLLESRIKLQKGLHLSNQLPQYTTHHQYMAMEDQEELIEGTAACRQRLRKLLKGLLKLQDDLLLQNDETKYIVTGEKKSSTADGSDEEIPSDDEEIASDEDEPSEKKTGAAGESGKRKIDMTNPGEEIAKRHKRFEEYRNSVIHSWYDKTRLASGKLSTKSFSVLEKSPVEQVQQIMMDKTRLIHRTQLKRSTYKVIGQLEKPKTDTPPDNGSDQTPEMLQTRKSTLDDTDPEIFDDDDFYHQLLKELIERKTADTTDPAQLTRQWLAVQKLRSKVKKVVDTRASKGRKLRYNIHPKMVSFMAPKDESTMTDEARNELFSSLFGNIKPEIVR